MPNITEQFKQAMRDAGLEPPDRIEPDKFMRFPSIGKSQSKNAGWCRLFPDGDGGSYGDWSQDIIGTWFAKKHYTPAERIAVDRQIAISRAQADQERKARYAAAASSALEIWKQAAQASEDHPYLKRKGIKPHGVKLSEGKLVIPIRIKSDICSLQFIAPDGEKRFLPSGQITGGYFSIGKPNDIICITEGFATGASVYEATGYAVAVAFNCGNLDNVTKAMRGKFPNAKLIVCADDDYKSLNNPGHSAANLAAQNNGGMVAIPSFGDNRPDNATDFNDMHQHCGLAAVKQAIERAMAMPPEKASLTNKSAVSTQVTSRKIDLVNAATIKPEAITWLWNDWLARGKLHILAGAAGTGKTTLSLSIAATISKGGLFADGSKAERGNVIIWSGEDDASDTIIPRLIGAGADLSRIQIINGCISDTERDAFDPSSDICLLQDAVTVMGGVSLFLIDPIVTAVSGDMHKANDVRRGLQPLVDFAMQNNAAILGITHFSKGSKGASPQERVIGSQAFSAVARVVLVAAKQDDGQTRVLAKAKANICLDQGGIEYEIEPCTLDSGINTTRVIWGEKIDGSSRHILDNVESPDFELDDDPKEALQRILREGAKDSKAVKQTMVSNGFSDKQTRKARERLNVVSVRDGFGAETKTFWSLPPPP
jgi:putative DNA primase/helicase